MMYALTATCFDIEERAGTPKMLDEDVLDPILEDRVVDERCSAALEFHFGLGSTRT